MLYENIDEIKEALSENAFRGAVEKGLERNFLKKENGVRYIQASRDYEFTNYLRGFVSELLSGPGVYYDNKMDEYLVKRPTHEKMQEEPQRYELKEWVEFDSSDEIKDIVSRIYETWDWDTINESRRYNTEIVVEDVESAIKDSLWNAGDEAAELEVLITDWIELLEDEFDVFYDYGIEQQLETLEFRADICFGVEEEWNTDYTNIITGLQVIEAATSGDPDFEGFTDYDREILENNSLTWLMETQGYTWVDYVKGGYANPERHIDNGQESTFLNSVRDEYANAVSTINNLTLLAQMTFDDYAKLMSGEGNLEVDPSKGLFLMGLFNGDSGGGSLLEIQPEKPFVFGRENVSSIVCEDHRFEVGDYRSIESCYGLVQEAWSLCLKPTDAKPIGAPKVDMEALEKSVDAVSGRSSVRAQRAIEINDAIMEFGGEDALREALRDLKEQGRVEDTALRDLSEIGAKSVADLTPDIPQRDVQKGR